MGPSGEAYQPEVGHQPEVMQASWGAGIGGADHWTSSLGIVLKRYACICFTYVDVHICYIYTHMHMCIHIYMYTYAHMCVFSSEGF